jgi:drug/metabolite transporter (DMT)-like permease
LAADQHNRIDTAANNSPILSPRDTQHHLRGYLLIASAALCWGAAATLGKAVFNGALFTGRSAIDPVILAQTRTSFSLLVLAPALLIAQGARALRVSRRDLLLSLLVGIVGIAGSNFFYYLAIQKSTVATAITVQYTAPVWVLLYLVARKQQRATVKRMAAVAMALFGSMLVVGIGSSTGFRFSSVGVLAALAAAFTYAFYNVGAAEVVQRRPSWLVMLYALLGSVLFWLVLNPPWKVWAQHYSPKQWGFLAAFAMISMLLPFNLYFAGLKYLDPTRAIVTSCLEPPFAIIFAAIFVAERIGALQICGMILVLTATLLIQMPERHT